MYVHVYALYVSCSVCVIYMCNVYVCIFADLFEAWFIDRCHMYSINR